MAQSYTRQSTFSDGDTITAALFNNEYNQLVNAFTYSSSSASSTGHRHDGTAGHGGNIHTIGDLDFLNKIVVDSTNNRWGFFVEVSSAAVEQIRLSDGVLAPVTDSDVDLGTSSLYFKNAYIDTITTTGAITSSSTMQGTTITATTAFVPDASDGAALGTSSLEFSDLFLADGAVINFGDDQDVSLTHVADTGLLLSSTDQLQFGDSGTYIHQSADGVLDLVSDTEIEINATTIDINGAADVSGNLAVGGNLTVTGNATISGNLTFGDAASDTVAFSADVASNLLPSADNTYDIGASGSEWKDLYLDGTANIDSLVADTADINGGTIDGAIIGGSSAAAITGTAITGTSFVIGSADISEAELETIDGVTAGTVAASKAVVVDSNKDIGTFRNLTIDGVFTDGNYTFDTSGNVSGLGTIASGAITSSGVITGTGFTIGSAVINEAELETIDGITAGTVIASKAIITDSNKDITGGRNITISGELDAATLDISGDADIDGTLEADAITVDGTALNEYIADTVGAMVSSNTETNITVTYEDGDNTLDFVIGTLNQDTTGTADNITVSANNSTDETVYPIFVDGATGSQGAESDTGLTYNPSSGMLTTTGVTATFTGNLTGNVTGNTSGTAATVTGAAQSNITSLGTLTTLTVDNVIINGTTIGHTSDTDLITLADGNVTIAGELDLTTLDVSGNADIDGTLEADAYTVNGTNLDEYIEDTVGAMLSSNTETGIAVTYQDGDSTIDFALDAAQTGITSLLATDIKIGEDDQTKIDFETADEIHFYAANAEQVYVADGIFGPQTDSDVDLGSTSVRWKDAYVDSITTTGNAAVGGNLTLTGDLTVNGTTTTVNSTTVTIDDPIFTLGGDSAPGSDDNKDRGIEFRWHNGSAAKVGFFGYDDSASAFTFVPDATNSSEVFSGTVGNAIFGDITGTLQTAAQTNITSLGTLTALTGGTGDFNWDSNTLVVDSSANRVGIGNASPDVSLDIGSFTDAVHVPTGTTAQRPGSPAAGYFRYNTTTSKFEGYTDSWGAIAGGGSGTNMDTNIYAGDGSDTTFTLSTAPDDEQNLMVFIDGVFQAHDSYSVSGTTLTFSTAPANGRVITAYHSTTTVGGSNNTINTMTGDGSDTTLTLSVAPVHENNVQVYFDGVYQSKANYSISGTTLTFSTAPPDDVLVEAITNTNTSSTTANQLLDADSDTMIQVEESSDEDKIRFDTGGTERMIIDSTGVGIGTSSPATAAGISKFLHIDGGDPGIVLKDSTANDLAEIYNAAGKLVIYGGSGGTNADSFAFDIPNNRLGIGTTSPARNLVVSSSGQTDLSILAGTSASAQLQFGDSGDDNIGQIEYNNSSNHMAFFTNASEAMRINSSGQMFIGDTTFGGTAAKFAVEVPASGAGCLIKVDSTADANETMLQFQDGAGQAQGSITSNPNANTTAYGTSSDYRLKENVSYTWDATTRLKQLKPARFNWKKQDASTVHDGFLAHEVSDIVSSAVVGAKDAKDSDDNPIYQQIDHSKLVPLLVKTIQELEARITALES